MRIQIGKQNPYSYTFTPSNGTLIIDGLLNYNINLGPPAEFGAIVSIYDVTASQFVPLTNVTIVKTTVASTQLLRFTLTWTTLPSGLNNGDTLIITIHANYEWAMYSLMQYQKA